MRYVWIAIIAASAAPLIYVGWFMNPIFIILVGVENWLDRIAQLYPYRWWILFLLVVCAFSVAVYTISYA